MKLYAKRYLRKSIDDDDGSGQIADVGMVGKMAEYELWFSHVD